MAYDIVASDPNVKLNIVSGPDSLNLKVRIADFRNFIDKLLTIKNGGNLFFKDRINDKIITLEIRNEDNGTRRLWLCR